MRAFRPEKLRMPGMQEHVAQAAQAAKDIEAELSAPDKKARFRAALEEFLQNPENVICVASIALVAAGFSAAMGKIEMLEGADLRSVLIQAGLTNALVDSIAFLSTFFQKYENLDKYIAYYKAQAKKL